MSESLPEVYLARHGETDWTVSGQHTGRTDLPLTARGERNAINLGERLRGIRFSRVLVSPLGRARRTCELAGYASGVEVVADLTEWDYGAYEGRLTAEIRAGRTGWYLFRDGCPGGETGTDVGARADCVIARLRDAGGHALLFGHGHFFRVLAARWIGLPPGGRPPPAAEHRVPQCPELRARPGRPGGPTLERRPPCRNLRAPR